MARARKSDDAAPLNGASHLSLVPFDHILAGVATKVAFSASRYKNITRKLVANILDNQFMATYRPALITKEFRQKFEGNPDAQPGMLVELLIDWNVEESEGVPLAITIDNLNMMGDAFMAHVWNAINKDILPNQGTGSR